MGTLTAILLYYHADLKQLGADFFNGDQDAKNYIINIVIATMPAICAGLITGIRKIS